MLPKVCEVEHDKFPCVGVLFQNSLVKRCVCMYVYSLLIVTSIKNSHFIKKNQ